MHSLPQTHMPSLWKRQPNLGGLRGCDVGPWVPRSHAQSSKAPSFSSQGGWHAEALHPLLKGDAWALVLLPRICGLSWTPGRVCHPEGVTEAQEEWGFLESSSFLRWKSSSPDPPHSVSCANSKDHSKQHISSLTSQMQNTILAAKTLLKHAERSTGFPPLWIQLYHCDCTITQTQETKKKKIDFPKPSAPLFT